MFVTNSCQWPYWIPRHKIFLDLERRQKVKHDKTVKNYWRIFMERRPNSDNTLLKSQYIFFKYDVSKYDCFVLMLYHYFFDVKFEVDWFIFNIKISGPMLTWFWNFDVENKRQISHRNSSELISLICTFYIWRKKKQLLIYSDCILLPNLLNFLYALGHILDIKLKFVKCPWNFIFTINFTVRQSDIYGDTMVWKRILSQYFMYEKIPYTCYNDCELLMFEIKKALLHKVVLLLYISFETYRGIPFVRCAMNSSLEMSDISF